MNYIEFEKELEKLDIEDKTKVEEFVNNINIGKDNYDDWVANLFDKNHPSLNLEKLPYIIDALYQSNDKILFMLCCMLIEATCDTIPFITPLENYRLFEAKYIELKHTLIEVYDHVDNGIANCMALIMLNNDPEFRYLNDEEKNVLINATIRKLNAIANYLDNNENIFPSVYEDLELIIDLASHMKNPKITELIKNLEKYNLTYSCKLFIIKYKLINNIEIANIEEMLENKDEIERLISIFEKENKLDLLPLEKITQESIARSNMIRWLEYPTEIGHKPEIIELLGEFEIDGIVCYAYKFKDSNFKIKDYMIGISGGYEKGKITACDTGWTFSNFELVNDNYINQAKSMVEQIKGYWENRNN